MQYKEVAGGICAPKGFAAAGVHCGIRANHSEKYDLALIKAEVRCAAAGVYTTNKVCGAPIKIIIYVVVEKPAPPTAWRWPRNAVSWWARH